MAKNKRIDSSDDDDEDSTDANKKADELKAKKNAKKKAKKAEKKNSLGGELVVKTDWKSNPDALTFLLTAYNDNCELDSKMNKNGWGKVTKEFVKETKLSYPKSVLQSKMTELKSLYSKFAKLRLTSGMGWDEETKMVVTSDEVWEKLIESDSTLAVFKGKGLPNYELLHSIFSGKTATGKFAAGGTNKDDDGDDDSLSDVPESDEDDDSNKKVAPPSKKKRKKGAPPTKRLHSEAKSKQTAALEAKSKQTDALNSLATAILDPTIALKNSATEMVQSFIERFAGLITAKSSLSLKKRALVDYELLSIMNDEELKTWAMEVDEAVENLIQENDRLVGKALRISRGFFLNRNFSLDENSMVKVEQKVIEKAKTISDFTNEDFQEWISNEFKSVRRAIMREDENENQID